MPPPSHSSGSRFYRAGKVFPGICTAAMDIFFRGELQLQSRPSSEMEPQRLHCKNNIDVADSEHGCAKFMRSWSEKEGQFACYLQGNRVARGTSIFRGEMVPRYTIVWSSESNPTHGSMVMKTQAMIKVSSIHYSKVTGS
jgi:hypothetical protein